MKNLLKKTRIFREQVKDRHTSHWDLDMLSREELEAVMKAQPGPAKKNPALQTGKK